MRVAGPAKNVRNDKGLAPTVGGWMTLLGVAGSENLRKLLRSLGFFQRFGCVLGVCLLRRLSSAGQGADFLLPIRILVMSGKPAARVGDPTACPLPGHGTNTIAAGSADVLFDGVPAARQGDPTACGSVLVGNVMPTVLINGLPATTLGTLGSHGNVVIGGSGTVIIGSGHTPAPFSAPAPLILSGAVQAAALASSGPVARQSNHDSPAEPWQEHPGDPAPLGLEEEEEEEELAAPTEQTVTLRVGVFFDGTGNNASNSVVGNQCRAAALQIGEQEGLAIYQRCQAFQLDPESSYANDVSNIWRLHELFSDEPSPSDALKPASLRVYVTGIGTTSGEKDTLLPGQAFGRGATGVLAKVEEGFSKLEDTFNLFRQANADAVLSGLELDIFGFSRGAAAARHFAKQILKREQGPLAQLLRPGKVRVSAGFAWPTAVSINFIGLFDTVAAIGGWDDRGNPADANNGDVDLYLPPDCARQVVHLVARDECRRNFALNRVAAPHREISLPGVHSDLGGGYQPKAVEHLYLQRPQSNWVSRTTPAQSTPAYRAAEQATAQARARDLLDPQDSSASLMTDVWEDFLPYSGGRGDQMKYVLAAPRIRRTVHGQLSRVYLRVMHALAVEAGVPLDFIDEFDAQLALPNELTPISEKLLSWARNGTGALTAAEERLLRQRYIHLSANWNASAGDGGSVLDVVFINAPAEGGRTQYADTPKGSNG